MSQPVNVVKITKEDVNNKEKSPTIKDLTIRIDVPDDSPELKELTDQIIATANWFEANKPFQKFFKAVIAGDKELAEEIKNDIINQARETLTSLNELLVANGQEPISEAWLWREVFETEPGRSTIVSIGRGMCFIPFYEYETFLGIMLRPMWFFYPPLFLGGFGYTGNPNLNVLPPRIEYADRLGCHLVRTTVFTGLYINIGELGFNWWGPSGLMILLGRARVVMV
ncbi:MAG: hypothetical protein ACQXXD_02755 [Thermoplasmatota archaeon]